MGRIFKETITHEELATKIIDTLLKNEEFEEEFEGDDAPTKPYAEWLSACPMSLYHLLEDNRIWLDIYKIQFDCENMATNVEEAFVGTQSIIGFQTLSNGLTCLGVVAGGDWEYPIYFIIYWDGKSLRAYVPNKGNHYNRKTKKAYGNGEDDDVDEHGDIDCDAIIDCILNRITKE